MWKLRRKEESRKEEAGTAVVDRPVIERPTRVDDDYPGSDQELQAEIDRLSEANRSAPDPDTERRILRLRHQAGIRQLVATGGLDADYPQADVVALPSNGSLPEFRPGQLTPELMRAAILRDGCVLVRGLVDTDAALSFAAGIERAFAERASFLDEGADPEPGFYEEFEGQSPFVIEEGARPWIREGGGVLAVDSPRLSAEMHELFRSAGLRELVGGYLGETPLISMQKTTLRKAEPQVPGAWHQDGAFMGDVRSLNLWLSLSRCGDESPGLDIVPRRLDDLVRTTTEEALLSYQVSQSAAEEAAGDKPIIRPVFEPGDALFFDEMFLHQTGSDPSMPHPRYAIESWFFGGSAFPGEYGPVYV